MFRENLEAGSEGVLIAVHCCQLTLQLKAVYSMNIRDITGPAYVSRLCAFCGNDIYPSQRDAWQCHCIIQHVGDSLQL